MLLFFILVILALVVSKFIRFTSSFVGNFIVALSVSMIIFAHITLLFSFLLGFGVSSIITGLILALPAIFVLKYKPEELKIRGKFPIYYLVIALVFITLCAYTLITQALFQTNKGLITGTGGMFGDTALHASFISRIETGEFPIQNPQFAGKILVYPLANDLLSAAFKSFGFSFNLAFSIPQIIFMSSFVILFYKVSRIFTSEKGSAISLLILLLGWGGGWIFFIREFLGQDLPFWQFLKIDYTNNEFYNLGFHNILTGLILPERSLLPGLVLGMLMVLYLVDFLKNGKLRSVLTSAVILGVLPFWHTHTFIFFLIFSLICLVYSFYTNRNGRLFIRSFILLGLVSGILALPFFYLFLTEHVATSFVRVKLGWVDQMNNPLLFWFKNSFLVIPLSILGFLKLKRWQRIYFIPALIIFLIANLVIFQPWDWDNIKLISWSFIFFSILVGVFLDSLLTKRILLKLVVILIVVTSTMSGLLSIILQLKQTHLAYDQKDIELALWANKNTGRDSVFIIDSGGSHPIPNLAGRLTYLGYPGHLWVHGIDYSKRQNLNKSILNGNIELISETDVPISFVVFSKNDYGFSNFQKSEILFQNGKYIVVWVNSIKAR